MKTPAQDQACRDRCAALLDNIADYVALHARRAPDALALVEHNTGGKVTWKQLDTAADAFAALLLAKGFRKGDVLATSPLNRFAKTDYMALRERAREIVAALRAKGKWDRAAHRE